MNPYERLWDQHRGIQSVLIDILSSLAVPPTRDATVLMFGSVRDLAVKLEEHLLVEDKLLYPMLSKRPDEVIRATAQRFSDDLGVVTSLFGKYVARWNSPQSIRSSHEAFVHETLVLAGALTRRINKEEKEFFPLVQARYAIESVPSSASPPSR